MGNVEIVVEYVDVCLKFVVVSCIDKLVMYYVNDDNSMILSDSVDYGIKVDSFRCIVNGYCS